MSRVFVADETALGRKVVVKVLRPDLAEGIRSERFRREILIAARLQQANIVPVLTAGTIEGLPYYTMPFVEGESLRVRLDREGALPIADVVAILKDVTKALQFAHERGIVHRDIKPDNVLLSGGTAVVTDFGIAKALSAARAETPGSTLTATGTYIGTPIYMAPEQGAGDPTDHRADLYALGVMAFELLVGRPPFTGASQQQLLAAHMTKQAPAVSELRTDCPTYLATVIKRLLEKEPAARPQTATEVLHDVDGGVITPNGELHQLEPVSRVRNAVPTLAKRKRLIGGLTALGVALVLIAGYATMQQLSDGTGRTLFAVGTLAHRERLLIADFQAPSSDSLLGAVVSEAVRTNLAQSRVVTVAPYSLVAGALQRMQRSATTRLDLSAARDVAQREGIKAVVDGIVTPVGQGFIVTARLVSAESGDQLASFRETARDASDLIPAIDRVTRSLRGKIGESLQDIRASPSLARVSTASLPALRKFTEGYRANYVEGNYRKGIAAFEEAIRLDSLFVNAYRMGANAYTLAGIRPGRADTLGKMAFRLRHRLPERERAQMEAQWYHSDRAGADEVKAMAAYEKVIELDPTDVNAIGNLARIHAWRREYAVAESLYRRALAVDTTLPLGLFNFIPTLVAEGKLAEADSIARLYQRRFPGNLDFPLSYWTIWAARGRFDSVAAVCSRARAAVDTQVQAWGHTCGGWLARREGKLRAWAREVAEARRLDELAGAVTPPFAALLDSAERSIWYRERMPEGLRAVDDIVAAIRTVPTRQRPYLKLVRLFSLAGRPDRARAMLSRYSVELDTTRRRIELAEQHRALGYIALAEQRYEDAIREFRDSDVDHGAPVPCPVCAPAELARAYDLANVPDSAIAIFERYLNVRWAYRLSNETDSRYQAGTYKRLGELYEARGDCDKAAEYYSKFIDLWKDADPELQPKVYQARQRLSRLGDREQVPR